MAKSNEQRAENGPRAVYLQRVEQVKRRLVPGRIIPDELPVTVIGHRRLRPQDFLLRGMDRTPLGGLWFPGRSAQVAFSRDAAVVTEVVFGREARSTDQLYEIPALDLMGAGYVAVSVPARRLPLHLHLVYAGQVADPSLPEVPLKARTDLVDLLNAHAVS